MGGNDTALQLKIDDETRDQIVTHYRDNSKTYEQIWAQLDTIQDRFRTANKAEKIAYLKISYINSAISIQAPVDQQEEGLSRLMAGNNLDTALESVNYHGQKRRYIRESLTDEGVWLEIVSALEVQDLDYAHEIAMEQLKFIGTVKAPFIFANLGYTDKMSIDANVSQVVGLDEHPSTSDINRYEELCQEIRNQFPELRKDIEPFHLHWLIFDWQRYTNGIGNSEGTGNQGERVTHHDAWFNAALSCPQDIKEVVEPIA